MALVITTKTAKALGVTIPSAVLLHTKEPVGALVVVADPTFTQNYGAIVGFAAKNRLPAIYPDCRAPEAGALTSYQTNLADLHRRAAGYVDKILKGAKPEALPGRDGDAV